MQFVSRNVCEVKIYIYLWRTEGYILHNFKDERA